MSSRVFLSPETELFFVKTLIIHKLAETTSEAYWVNMLTNSSGTNHSLNDHEDVGQYGPYAIPSEVMPCYSHPASLVNQNEIPIDLLC